MIVYGDTSALIKLVVKQTGTSEMLGLRTGVTLLAAAQIAYVELRAAVAAVHRDRRLRPAQYEHSKARIESLWQSTSPLEVDASLVRHAGQLAADHGLRGYDAVHLAALTRLRPAPECTLASWDGELRRAASALGYPLFPPAL